MDPSWIVKAFVSVFVSKYRNNKHMKMYPYDDLKFCLTIWGRELAVNRLEL